MIQAIPETWKIKRIDDLADFSGGHGFTPRDWSDHGLPIIRIQNLNGSKDFNYYAEEPEPKWIVYPGELLFAWAGVKGVSFGPCIWSGAIGLLNQHIYRVQPKEGIDKNWLFLALEQVTHEIEAHAHGFKHSLLHVRKSEIVNQLVSVPPIDEQKIIVRICNSINEAIAHAQAVIDQIQVVKRGLMQQLLTKGLPGWHEISEIKTQELSKISRKITDGSHQAVKVCVDGSIPFLYVSCIRYGAIQWEQTARITLETYLEISRGREPKEGVILYTAVGSYGQAVMLRSNEPLAFQRHIAYIDLNKEEIEPRFLVHWLNSHTGRSQAHQIAVGNAQKTVTLGDLARFRIPIFPLNEQQKIADILDSVDHRLRIEQDKQLQLEIIKKGLMQQLLTGKRRVPVDAVTGGG